MDSLLLASAFWDEPPSSNTLEAQKTQSLHQILYQLRAPTKLKGRPIAEMRFIAVHRPPPSQRAPPSGP